MIVWVLSVCCGHHDTPWSWWVLSNSGHIVAWLWVSSRLNLSIFCWSFFLSNTQHNFTWPVKICLDSHGWNSDIHNKLKVHLLLKQEKQSRIGIVPYELSFSYNFSVSPVLSFRVIVRIEGTIWRRSVVIIVVRSDHFMKNLTFHCRLDQKHLMSTSSVIP